MNFLGDFQEECDGVNEVLLLLIAIQQPLACSIMGLVCAHIGDTCHVIVPILRFLQTLSTIFAIYPKIIHDLSSALTVTIKTSKTGKINIHFL